MKKTLIAALTLLMAFPALMAAPEGKTDVTVISYNIMDGFKFNSDTDKYQSVMIEDRENKVAEWLKSKGPNIVGLTEFKDRSEADLKAFGAKYGHSYTALLKTRGYSPAVTSDRPIEVVKKQLGQDKEGLPYVHHGFIHVRTYGIDILVVHPSPFSYERRLEEARCITDYIRSQKLTRVMVMGDFNAFTAMDAEELESVPNLGVDSYRVGKYDYCAMSEFLSLPLHDTIAYFIRGHRARMTYPAHRDTIESDGQRLDYILTSPELAPCATAAWVWNQATLTKPPEEHSAYSDHYPVGIRLQLDTKDIPAAD